MSRFAMAPFALVQRPTYFMAAEQHQLVVYT